MLMLTLWEGVFLKLYMNVSCSSLPAQINQDTVCGNVVKLEGNQPLQYWSKIHSRSDVKTLTWEGKQALLQGRTQALARRRSSAPWPGSRERCRCSTPRTAASPSTCPPPTSTRSGPGSSTFEKLTQLDNVQLCETQI